MPFPTPVPSILRDYGPKQETWGLQTGAVTGLALPVRLTASGDVFTCNPEWAQGPRGADGVAICLLAPTAFYGGRSLRQQVLR